MTKIHWSDICPSGEALHVSYVVRPESGSWKSHTHDYYEVFLVDSGRGTHLVGEASRPFPLLPGQIHFIRMRDIHGFRAEPSTEPFALINVAFSREAWLELRRRYHLGAHPFFAEAPADPPMIQLPGETWRELATQFRELVHEKRSALTRDGFLLTLARRLGSGTPMPGLAAAPAWLRKCLLGFSRDPGSWSGGASGLAKQAGCSTGHLSRTMRASLGMTPSEWILEARLRRAAQLLEATGLGVSDVSLEAGFNNLSHFHRCFRSQYEKTPLQYRKERMREVV